METDLYTSNLLVLKNLSRCSNLYFKSFFLHTIIKFKLASCLIFSMTNETQVKIEKSELSTGELIRYFREKCSICAHHRIMHDDLGKCEGVMNKPCTSGCDKFNRE